VYVVEERRAHARALAPSNSLHRKWKSMSTVHGAVEEGARAGGV
jgi:hypothetical protein